MASYRGTVEKNDLEGGFWQLKCDDGNNYQLRGGGDDLRVAGQKVAIEGKVDDQAMGFAMSGPILDVQSWTKA